jgi:hypothetical protein
MASAWRNIKNNCSRPLFIIIFKPKIVVLDPNFILRVKTMHESVKEDFIFKISTVYKQISVLKVYFCKGRKKSQENKTTRFG